MRIRFVSTRPWYQAIQLCDTALFYDSSRADRPYRRVAEYVDRKSFARRAGRRGRRPV